MRPDGTSRVPIGPGGTEGADADRLYDGRFIARADRLWPPPIDGARFDGKDERILVSSGWTEYPVW